MQSDTIRYERMAGVKIEGRIKWSKIVKNAIERIEVGLDRYSPRTYIYPVD